MTRAPCNCIFAITIALLAAACATLPAGIPRAPDGDPTAALLTLPSGRSVPVYAARLTYSGEATLVSPDGRTYRGEWRNGKPHGHGKETLPDGSVYDGGWQRGRRHGHGELTFADGGRFVGQFVDGIRQGNGTLTSAEGAYRGEWAADVPHGQGVFEGRDGARYDGEWQLGQRAGFGRYVTAAGDTYEGEWSDDQPHGFGRLDAADGSSYAGGWKSGQRDGYGWAEGPPGLVYEGTWVADQRDGYGREQLPDGSSYVGEWRADKREGHGVEVRLDGSFHDGAWSLNRPAGPGERRAATGIEIRGVWNGDLVASGELKLPTGLEYTGPLFPRAAAVASPRLAEWLRGAAVQGDPYAQLVLGTLYLDFDEPAPDIDEARRWLTRAAAAGLAEAQFRLALTYEDMNPPRVVELLAEAARQSHPLANETLGEYYYGGITVPRSLERAIGYFQRAVDGGSVTARNNLAWLLATADDARFRDGKRALALIRGVALSSGSWEYLDTLAAAWAALGAYDKAVDAAARAVEAARAEPGGAPAGEVAAMERRLAGYRSGRGYIEPPPVPVALRSVRKPESP